MQKDKAEASGPTDPRSSKSEAFAELSRLARESTSSWSENVPGRQTDRAFLLLIVIAIILLSGIIMIAGYREQLTEKFDELKALTSQSNLETGTESRVSTQPPMADRSVNTKAPTSAELELKLANLEERLALLQHKLDMLETSAPPRDITTPKSTPAGLTTLDDELPRQQPELILAEPEPDQTSTNILPARVETSESAMPPASETADEHSSMTTTPTKPAATIPALAPDVSEAGVADQKMKLEGSPDTLSPTNNWYINLAAYSQQSSAKPLYERARKIAKADIQEVVSGTRTVYRVRAIGYPSAEEAREDTRRLESLLGLKDTWVSNK